MTGPYDDGMTDQAGRRQHGSYRHVSRAAVWSLIFGLASVVTPLSWFLGVIPAIGIGLAWWALVRIRDYPSELTGRYMAVAGLSVSAVLLVASFGWLTFRRVQECPFGYQRLTYQDLQPDPSVRGEALPPTVFEFQDKKVFLKGYMQPTRQRSRLKKFILSPAVHDCPSCIPNPKPTEMIQIELMDNMETRYTTRLMGVGGKFIIKRRSSSGVPYRLEADVLK